jgi:DNA-binding PadR family transcriptional regulator
MHEAHAMHGPWRAGHRRHGPGFFAMERGRGPWGGPFPPPLDVLFRGLGGHGHGRGRRARRGDVRAALLLLLAEEPQNGYQLIQEIERRSGGMWKPSPGSVYPALQQLEDEGLVRAQETEGRRAYALTDAGREYVEANREQLGDPWEAVTGGMDEGMIELRGLIMQVGGAAMQATFAGHAEQVRRILVDARRALYRVLADEDPEPPREV